MIITLCLALAVVFAVLAFVFGNFALLVAAVAAIIVGIALGVPPHARRF